MASLTASQDRGARNSRLLDAALDGMSIEDRRSAEAFILGYVSGLIPEAEWAQAVNAMVRSR